VLEISKRVHMSTMTHGVNFFKGNTDCQAARRSTIYFYLLHFVTFRE
jgi:hypothetical protein